ncbi:hypothetical protein [Cupriavidus sp. H18C1]|uniref:hypothetical protein n=1 Tax=Cupriavidus sp. H18C1 TaxID=3241601 RepID=UPI003BB8BBAC
MLLPLLLRGAGPLSLDGLLMHRRTHGNALPAAANHAGHAVWSAVLILLGLPLALLLPWAGGALIVIGIALAALCRASARARARAGGLMVWPSGRSIRGTSLRKPAIPGTTPIDTISFATPRGTDPHVRVH